MKMFGFAGMSLCAAVIAFAGIGSVQAGPSDWTGQGPFGGNMVTVKADPLVPTRVYAMTGNGFFRSDDAGTSWSAAETGLLAPHPTNGIFAVSGATAGVAYLFDDLSRLYATADAGATWTATGYTLPQPLVGQQAVIGNEGPISFIALAAGPGNTVWLAANDGGLLFSANGGATFAPAGNGFPSGAGIEASIVITNPSAPQDVVVGTQGTICDAATGACPIYWSTNNGASWTAVANPNSTTIAGQHRHPTQMSSAGASSVYAIYEDEHSSSGGQSLILSTNNGQFWSVVNTLQGVLGTSPSASNIVFLDQLVSTNSGASFSPISTTGLTTNGTFVPRFASVALAADYATSGRIWAGTVSSGMYLSQDHATTWTPSSTGITATNIRAVTVHPLDNTRVYAGFGDARSDPSQAFFRLTSGGQWMTSNTGLKAYELRSIYIDPTTAQNVGTTVIYASGWGYDTAPPQNGTHNSGLYKSLDGGLTWATENGGIPGNYVGVMRTLIGDPRSCDARSATAAVCAVGDPPLKTFYVTSSGRSTTDGSNIHNYLVLRSTDGGVTWSDRSIGLPHDVNIGIDPTGCPYDYIGGITPIVMDPSNSNTLYVGTFSEAADAACNPAAPTVLSGVYKTTDGGANWSRVANGLPRYSGTTDSVLDALSLAIDPSNPQRLWVSMKNLLNDPDLPGSIYRTTDGGANWTLSNAGIAGMDVRVLLADGNNPGTVYAGSAGSGAANPGGVYKSTDYGTQWTSISAGFPALSSTALALDPIDPSVLYAGTNGGVYTMVQLPDDDADGVPDLIENSGPNGGDANHDSQQDSGQANVGTTAPGLFGVYGWQQGVVNASSAARMQQLKDKLQQLKSGSTTDGIQGGYFTVQVDNAICPQAVDVTADLPGPLGLDKVPHHGTYTYPRGLVHFEVPGCASTDVDVIFNAATFGPGWTWRYYGPSTPGDNSTMGWHDATSLVASQITNDWKIHLANGAFGSYRPASVNSILFKGGPAYNEEIFTDNFEP